MDVNWQTLSDNQIRKSFWSINKEIWNSCSIESMWITSHTYSYVLSSHVLLQIFFFFIIFFFFYLGFTALSIIFHLYRTDHSSKVGENRRTREQTTWPSVSRTWLSHMWPERGSNHSGEKPNGLRELSYPLGYGAPLLLEKEMDKQTVKRYSIVQG